MASKTATRSLHVLTKRIRPSLQCLNATSTQCSSLQHFSISSGRRNAEETEVREPRWKYTPAAMIAPLPARPRDPTKAWECNESPEKLDQFYEKFLGKGGANVLTDEVKWLAITHKSFDQGRRGFNDRLAFFGRRIINLQTTLALLHSPTATKTQSLPDPSNDRVPFTHPALDGLGNLTDAPIGTVLTKQRLGTLASQLGMREIIRWKPRDPQHLGFSGIDAVLTSTLYAIIGAIALQRGSDVANKVTRERILKRLGIE